MIFLDANFLISLFVEDHNHNKIAVKIWEKIRNEELIISNSVILEVITVLNIKLKVSKDILEDAYINLNDDKFKIVDDIGVYDEGMENLLIIYPKRIPLFDSVYMALMKELEIKEIATFDKHFDNMEGILRITKDFDKEIKELG